MSLLGIIAFTCLACGVTAWSYGAPQCFIAPDPKNPRGHGANFEDPKDPKIMGVFKIDVVGLTPEGCYKMGDKLNVRLRVAKPGHTWKGFLLRAEAVDIKPELEKPNFMGQFAVKRQTNKLKTACNNQHLTHRDNTTKAYAYGIWRYRDYDTTVLTFQFLATVVKERHLWFTEVRSNVIKICAYSDPSQNTRGFGPRDRFRTNANLGSWEISSPNGFPFLQGPLRTSVRFTGPNPVYPPSSYPPEYEESIFRLERMIK